LRNNKQFKSDSVRVALAISLTPELRTSHLNCALCLLEIQRLKVLRL